MIDETRDGAVTSETVTIDKIADEGITLTIALLESDGGKSSKQILVPYDSGNQKVGERYHTHNCVMPRKDVALSILNPIR